MDKIENKIKQTFGNQQLKKGKMNTLRISKYGQCNNYCIFIASRHFESIDDFIHLEMVTKRFRGNIEKFHYNPISLTNKLLPFFPNVETLHLYDKNDDFLIGGRIFKYCVWFSFYIYYDAMKKKKRLNEEGYEIEYKRLSYYKSSREYDYNEIIKDKENDKKEGDKVDFRLENGIIKIEENCFENYFQIKTITIPSSVKRIGKKAFSKCSVEKVIFNEGLKELNDSLFEGCSSLKSITIPNSVTRIGKYCFYDCKSLSYIDIPTSVKIIEDNCFAKCISIERMIIPQSVTKIGCNIFCEMNNLLTLEIPQLTNMTTIGKDIFINNECELISLSIPTSVKRINGKSEFEEITRFEIPTTIKIIGDDCFSDKTTLEEILIPTTVTEIGTRAFYNCKSLKKLNIPRSVTKIGFDIIDECPSLEVLVVSPYFNLCYFETFFSNCLFLKELTISFNNILIDYFCEMNYPSLTKISTYRPFAELNRLYEIIPTLKEIEIINN